MSTVDLAPRSPRIAHALEHQVLRVVAGSTLNGLDLPGSDRDEVGIFVESPLDALGLQDHDGTLQIRPRGPNERSRPGDVEVTLYSLRHFLRLAAKGNPSLLAVLWAPPESVLVYTPLGLKLRDLRDQFVTREAGRRFLGYLDSQLARLTGARGGAPVRPELVEAHGYDTKFASHALRLGLQGIEMLRTGRITLPMAETERERVMAIKTGSVNFEQAVAQIQSVRTALGNLVNSPRPGLRQQADVGVLGRWSVDAHLSYWGRA